MLFRSRDADRVTAAAVLLDGRVITGSGGSGGGRVLVWDPAHPGAAPAELGRVQDAWTAPAVAVLPDGRVVIGGARQVRLWNVQSSSPGPLLACSVRELAISVSPSGACLFISHAAGGLSCWEIRPTTQSTLGARHHPG